MFTFGPFIQESLFDTFVSENNRYSLCFDPPLFQPWNGFVICPIRPGCVSHMSRHTELMPQKKEWLHPVMGTTLSLTLSSRELNLFLLHIADDLASSPFFYYAKWSCERAKKKKHTHTHGRHLIYFSILKERKCLYWPAPVCKTSFQMYNICRLLVPRSLCNYLEIINWLMMVLFTTIINTLTVRVNQASSIIWMEYLQPKQGWFPRWLYHRATGGGKTQPWREPQL